MLKRLLRAIVPSEIISFLQQYWRLPYQLKAIEACTHKLEAGHASALDTRLIATYVIRSHWRLLDLIYTKENMVRPTICRLCGFKGSSEQFKEYVSTCIFHGGNLTRHQCPACDVIFGPAKVLDLDQVMLGLDYRLHYSVFSEGDSTAKILRAFQMLQPRKDGLYLDYGCGVANPNVLKIIRNEGYNILGFEPSLHKPSEMVLNDMNELRHYRFDGIFSHNVLEHLFDPIGTTRFLADLLRPDGLLIHATPCFEYRYEYTRFHVYFFTGRSRQLLAQGAGMAIRNFVRDRDGDFMALVLQHPRNL